MSGWSSSEKFRQGRNAKEASFANTFGGYLDIALRKELLHLFRELLLERNTAALYVTHDPREAARLADRLIVLDDGRVVQQGTLLDLRFHPATRFVERLVEDLGTVADPVQKDTWIVLNDCWRASDQWNSLSRSLCLP